MKNIDFHKVRETAIQKAQNSLLVEINRLSKKYNHLSEEFKYNSILKDLFELWPFLPSEFSNEKLSDLSSIDRYKVEFVYDATQLYIDIEKQTRPEVFLNHFFNAEIEAFVRYFNYRDNFKNEKNQILSEYLGPNLDFLLTSIIYNIEYWKVITGSFMRFFPAGVTPDDASHLKTFLGIPEKTEEKEERSTPEEDRVEENHNEIGRKDLAMLLYLLDRSGLLNFTTDKNLTVKLLNTKIIKNSKPINKITLNSYLNDKTLNIYLAGQNNMNKKQLMAQVLRNIANKLDN